MLSSAWLIKHSKSMENIYWNERRFNVSAASLRVDICKLWGAVSADSERGLSQILGQTMTFLKFFELTLFRVIASEFCNSREPAEEGKVWEHEQHWLSEHFQNTRRQILVIKRNRKLCGSLLPWELQCVCGGWFSRDAVLFAGLFWGWPQARTTWVSPQRRVASARVPVCVLLSPRDGGTAGICPIQGCTPPRFLWPSQSHLPFEMEISSRFLKNRNPSAVPVFLLATALSQEALNREMSISHTPAPRWRRGVGMCVGCPEIGAVSAVALGTDSLFFLSWELTL